MTQTVFAASQFNYPYRDLTFPGQHTEETILFVTREGSIMLTLRLGFAALIVLGFFFARSLLIPPIRDYLPAFLGFYKSLSFLVIAFSALIAIWWVYTLWKKSVFIITTRRLTKFIYTTPFNRYQLSLGLDKIVDTGAYKKGNLQALTGLGYFVARSAAGNIKNFKIVNISFAEDLHNYINKLLYTFNRERERLDRFRPFIPHLKGETRERYVTEHTPEYQKEPQPPSAPPSN